MEIEVGEEISMEEYNKLPGGEGMAVINQYENKTRYFKKAQKFPIKHIYNNLSLIIHEAGLTLKEYGAEIFIGKPDGGRFKILEQFIEKAKEVLENEKGKNI